MRKVILIKHARPEVVPDVPSHEWVLSEEGRGACPALAERVAAHGPEIVVASEELKAAETGKLVAERLGKPFKTAPGLEEHDRSNVPQMQPRDFISLMALFFKDRDRLVLGQETADEALDRVAEAVDRVLEENPKGNIAIVTHGTVLALLAAERAGLNGYQLWRRMGLPSFIAFSLPEWKVVEAVEKIV